MLEKEFQYYIDHQDELVLKYRGKYLVIKGDAVVGSYPSLEEAYIESGKKYELGTFLIQLCEPGKDNYTVRVGTSAIF